MNTKTVPKPKNRSKGWKPQNERGDGKNMTLDDAISHLDDLLDPDVKWNDCVECREEHMLLRQWLIELRDYRNGNKR